MKKKSLKSLTLNKRSISNFSEALKGGSSVSQFDCNSEIACFTAQCSNDCPSGDCFVRESELVTCNCAG